MPLSTYGHEQEIADRGWREEVEDDIMDAHAAGRAHYTEIPRSEPNELERLHQQIDSLRRQLRPQRLIHDLIQELDAGLSRQQMSSDRDSAEHICATSMRQQISQFRRDWIDAGGQ